MSWLEPSDVSDWLKQPPDEDAALIAQCAAAVEPFVQQCRPDQMVGVGAAAEYTPDKEVYSAAVMMAARLYRRRNSPGGLVQMGDILSSVPRWDPEIERALRIGLWQQPRIG